MEARDYFFRLSYEQYKAGKVEEREKWELEVLRALLNEVKKDVHIDTPCLDNLAKYVGEIELIHSNSFEIEKVLNNILKIEENEKIIRFINNCWVASWDLPDTKNASVGTSAFCDDSHLVKINTEFLVNLSRIAWLYATILLIEDITPYADFRDRLTLNSLKEKYIKDLKKDTDEGTEYLMDCSLTFDTKRIIKEFAGTFFEASLVFIVMHEIGHVLELNEDICKQLGLISSKTYVDVDSDKRQREAEKNADWIGQKYSDKYIGVQDFFNMGPVLAILTLAINHKSIKKETDHPSIKSRYEKALKVLFDRKDSMEVLHTRKLLRVMCAALQDENCWSEQDKDWWTNEIGIIDMN